MLPAIHVQGLPRDESGAGRQQEHNRAAKIFRILMALDAPIGRRRIVLRVIPGRGNLRVR